MAEFILSDRIGHIRFDLYHTYDSCGVTMRLCLGRPFVLEASGQRIRRFGRRDAAVRAYKDARAEAVAQYATENQRETLEMYAGLPQ